MDSRFRHTARSEGLVTQEMGAELLIYDERTDVAHCLAPAAATVWRLCDGDTDFAGLVVGLSASGTYEDAEMVAAAAIDELGEKGLLQSRPSGGDGVSRRQALKRMAGAGMAAAAAPLVVSAAVASPAQALTPACSTANATCTATSQCCTGLTCTRGTAATGQQYCNASTSCIGPGKKPAGGNCDSSAANRSECCSNACSGNFCA